MMMWLCPGCKDLLKQLLRSNPDERMKMPGIMSHPWMNEGHTLPFGPAVAVFPNKIQLADINTDILQHMVHVLKVNTNSYCICTRNIHDVVNFPY